SNTTKSNTKTPSNTHQTPEFTVNPPTMYAKTTPTKSAILAIAALLFLGSFQVASALPVPQNQIPNVVAGAMNDISNTVGSVSGRITGTAAPAPGQAPQAAGVPGVVAGSMSDITGTVGRVMGSISAAV
ncbi:hypothetical protein HK102_001958, partial [Quaeritorhiza haematococci]